LSQLFSKNYFFSKSFIGAIVVGYSLGALQLGYVAAYYLFSQRFLGGWSPLESPYYNVASSFIPWIFPLTVGLSAALNEELFFRMFSISFLKKWFSSTILAVGIPALIWGFLHSNYYVEPIYSRGIELALVGIVFGLVYLKWGVVPVILTHYVYNSVLGFIPLLRSESLFFKKGGKNHQKRSKRTKRTTPVLKKVFWLKRDFSNGKTTFSFLGFSAAPKNSNPNRFPHRKTKDSFTCWTGTFSSSGGSTNSPELFRFLIAK
jgi:membrane protease YdiL (CAAX protease family)